MAKKKKVVNLNDIYNQVARKADLAGISLNVTETRRVIACFFDQLEDLSAAEAMAVLSKALKNAGARKR